MRLENAITFLTILFMSYAVTLAADDLRFAESRDEIIETLTSIEPEPRTRSMGDLNSMRGVTVRKKAGGQDVTEKVYLHTGSNIGSVNLKVMFNVDSSSLQPEAYLLLSELGAALLDKRLLHETITISGHTDSDGEAEYNRRLSLRRAESVKEYLVKSHDISPSRLVVQGFGEGLPLVPNSSVKNKQLNRRVEIRIIEISD